MDDISPQLNTGPGQTDSEISIVPTYEYFLASPYFADFGKTDPRARESFLVTFASLSGPLKKFLAAPQTANQIYSLGEEYELAEDRIPTIASLIRDVVVGSLFVKDFPTLLASKLSLDEEKSSAMANRIASELFSPILEDIKNIQRQKFGDKIKLMQVTPEKVDTETFIKSQSVPSMTPPPPPLPTPPPISAPPVPPKPPISAGLPRNTPRIAQRPSAPSPSQPQSSAPPIAPIPQRPDPGTMRQMPGQQTFTPPIPKPQASPRPPLGEARSERAAPSNLPRPDIGGFTMPPKLDMSPKPPQASQSGNVLNLRDKK